MTNQSTHPSEANAANSLKRNRAVTMQRIGDAMTQLIAQQGLQGITMNALAQQADVSKGLIYRYFGGISGIPVYLLQQGSLVPRFSSVDLQHIQLVSPMDMTATWTKHARQFVGQLRASQVYRALLLTTLQEKGAMSMAIHNTLDEALTTLVSQLPITSAEDSQALTAIIWGGLVYLMMQAHLDRPVLGIDLRSEEGWKRIDQATSLLYKALANASDA